MQVNYNMMNEYSDFLHPDAGTVSGLRESVGDRFTTAAKAFDFLSTDLSLDDAILDLEELA